MSNDPFEVLSLTYAPADSQHLADSRRRDLARGTTSVGPHRDELLVDLDGRPAANYASRAQQRAAALSMRLAEADFLSERTDGAPILLLDDVLSELDPPRRERTLDAISAIEQVIITTADPASVPVERSDLAASYEIVDGSLVERC